VLDEAEKLLNWLLYLLFTVGNGSLRRGCSSVWKLSTATIAKIDIFVQGQFFSLFVLSLIVFFKEIIRLT